MGLQGLDGRSRGAVAFEEQRMERVEEGGFAKLVGLAQHGDAVADPLDPGGLPGEAADVGQSKAADPHACTSWARP